MKHLHITLLSLLLALCLLGSLVACTTEQNTPTDTTDRWYIAARAKK